MVSIVSRGEPAIACASSLLGKYEFGGEPGLTCAFSMNSKYGVVLELDLAPNIMPPCERVISDTWWKLLA